MGIVILIILVNAAASFAAFNSADLMNRLLMRPYAIKNYNQWYRFITSGFIHANWTHLLFNMLVFYSFGQAVVSYYNYYFGSHATYYFIILYLGSMVTADLPTYIKHRNDSWYASLGASGAVSAVLFTSILINPLATVYFYFFPMPGIVMGVLYLIYSWYMARKGGIDNINHDAHFYGALCGIIFTLLLRPAFGSEFIGKLLHVSF
ncbi:MAG: rhomboid family intramembrane serine protease [Chitinophagales bacterium]|nr:rhomboid family intramembrane serine protease [Chitinophagales bacterium]